jgi:arabinofuranosyltransferase
VSGPERPGTAAVGVAGLAAVLLALAAVEALPHQGDDGFIFLRYAERMTAGIGVGFTGQSPPVEGYSSPLWLGLLLPLVGAGVPGPLAVKLLGIAALGGWMAGLWALVRALGGRPIHAALAWVGLAILRPPFFWAFAGLETPLVGALLALTAWGLARGEGRWAVGAGLLGVLRPEGPAMAVGTLLLGALRDGRRPSWTAVVGSLAPASLWLAVRLALYRDVLPNTFYAKATGAPVEQLGRGLAYAGLVTPGLALVLGGLVWGHRASLATPSARARLAVAALASGQLAVVIVGGGDWMWYGRLLVPILPLLLALALSVAPLPGPPRLLVGAGAGLALVLHLAPPSTWGRRLTLTPLPVPAFQEGGMTFAEAAAGRWIAARAAPGDRIAVNHAGALPWAARELAILDMTGLLERTLARRAGGGLHAKYDVDYVLGERPDWVVLHTRTPPGPDGAIVAPDYWAGETALLEDPRFQAAYAPTGATWGWDWTAEGRSWTVVYRRRPGQPTGGSPR